MRKLFIAASVAAALLGTLMVPASAGPPEAPDFQGGDGDDVYLTNGNNAWVLDADTGTATHHNLKNAKSNEIPIADFLDVYYEHTGKAPGVARLTAVVECESGSTWRSTFARGVIVKSVAWADGVAVSLEAPEGSVEDRTSQTGQGAFVMQGRFYPDPDDNALVNAHLTGEDPGAFTSDTDGAAPAEYDVAWDDTGALPAGGTSWVNNKLTTPIDSGDGYGIGRCGTTFFPGLDVQEDQSLIWYTAQFERDDLS